MPESGFSLQTLSKKLDKETGQTNIQWENYYCRFIREGKPPVYLQSGSFWDDQGIALEFDREDDIWDSVRAVSAEKLEKIKFKPPSWWEDDLESVPKRNTTRRGKKDGNGSSS
jgi:hypothetical protein